ncbi:hypothetical protein D3H55_14240 [Bacillus salacetis]|uniref:Uncharacterized protein n=1 Tax=Bacillus salacetis TaxID=2315464 RepID=A0A3A1QWN5_9BACI|nr:hypothetical protein [Bacillus salacetis]RIW32031.1 hypothetical protein D3H55_14240 [Bacillus salacetis]
MDLFILVITIGIITSGFFVLFSMKKRMESKLASIKANLGSDESSAKAKSIIRWIWGTAAWGVVSMLLVVNCFHHFFG